MSNKTPSILIGGVATAVLATILSLPQNQCLGCLVCLCYVGSGLIAVWHYTNTNTLTIKGGEGAGLGAMAGVVCGVVAGVLGLIFRAIGLLPSVDDIIEQMEQTGQLDQLDPETADMIYSFIEVTAGIGGIVIGVIFAVILGVIGGAIGASVFKKGTATPGEASDVG